MSIVYSRVDGRMIHGQVASIFAKVYQVDEILVVNDKAAMDDDQIMLLELAVPFGCDFRVLTCEEAAECFLNEDFDGTRTMIVYRNVQDALKTMEAGYPISTLHIGGMYNEAGKKEIDVALFVDDDDRKVFRQLEEKGVKLIYQVSNMNKEVTLSKVLDY